MQNENKQQDRQSEKPQNQEAPKHQVGHELAERESGGDMGQPKRQQNQQSGGRGQQGSANSSASSKQESAGGNQQDR